MKLILSGGGDPKKTKKTDKLFINLIGNKKILYIPIAKKTRLFRECYLWIQKVFSDAGFKREIIMWTDLNNKSLKEINEFGGIFIGGGNTFSLLKDLKDSSFLGLLNKYIKNEMGVVYGASAGAIIFGKDISIAKDAGDENIVNLTDLKSLDLLNNRNIWPHYNTNQDKLIFSNLNEDIKIIAIPEGSGIFINGKKQIYFGEISIFESN